MNEESTDASDEDILKVIIDSIAEANREIGKVNILIAGRTGVGKSTLINAVFHGRFAETGQGKPVTKETRKIQKKGIPLAIYDTRGFELKEYEQVRDELEDLVRKKSAKDPHARIHAAWICIAEDIRRVEEAEIWLHHMLAEHMPVLGVITKARSDRGFKADVQKLLPKTKNVVRVRALPEELDDGHKMPPEGLNALVKATAELVPEAFQQAWAASQKASLDEKKKAAHKAVAKAATLAAGVGLAPIPLADAIPLVAIQITMLVRISKIFGIDPSRNFLGTLVAAIAGTAGFAFAGRAIVSGLLKLTGVGTPIGSAIAATTAGTLTTTLGEVYIAVLAKLFEDTGEAPSTDEIEREFKDHLSRHQGGRS